MPSIRAHYTSQAVNGSSILTWQAAGGNFQKKFHSNIQSKLLLQAEKHSAC